MLKRALVLWIPIVLLALISIGIMSYRDYKARELIYLTHIDDYPVWNDACEAGQHSLVCKRMPEDFRFSLHASVDHVSDVFRSEIHKQIEPKLKLIEQGGINTGKAAIVVLYEKNVGVFPDTFSKFSKIEIPRCRWYKVPYSGSARRDCGKRMVLKPLAATYSGLRNEMQTRTKIAIYEGEGAIEGGADRVRELMYRSLEIHLSKYRKSAKRKIDSAFTAFYLLSVLSITIIALSLVKALAFIVARMVFDKGIGGQPLKLSPSLSRGRVVRAEEIGSPDGESGYSLATNKKVWYASYSGGINPIEHGEPRFPQIGQLFLRRLFASKLKLHKFTPDTFSTFGGHANFSYKFVKISLQPGDIIYFQVENLVAFSEGIKFKSLLNPKLAALLQYKFFFPSAYGNGEIILRADGGTLRLMPKEGIRGSDPLDMIAFDLNGSFYSKAQHDVISVYTEGHTVVPSQNTLAIQHAPGGMRHSGGKAIRRILFFLLPI